MAETAALPAAERDALKAFFLHGLRITALAQAAGVPVMAGTDASDTMIVPGFSLHRELRLLREAGLSPMAVIGGMMLILIFLGCFVDQVSMMLITLPFFMPLVQRYGIDPLWFGVLFLICMQLGLLTPPFGLLLFTMKGVAPPAITMRQVYRAALPYAAMGLVMLALILAWPPIATWLPSVLSR